MVAPAVSFKNAVALFHALSDETRLALLERLKGGEHCVCELTDAMKAGQSRLSFHLKVLKEANLVRVEVQAQQRIYSLNPTGITEIEDWVSKMKQLWEARFDALDELLKEEVTKLNKPKRRKK